MNYSLSVLLPFACLANQVFTKTGITEKGKSYTINFNYYLLNNNNNNARIAPIYFFNAILPSIIYYTT